MGLQFHAVRIASFHSSSMHNTVAEKQRQNLVFRAHHISKTAPEKADATRMNLTYDMPLYRPPAEGNNLIIQATLGCSFNQCSFCAMYRSKQYAARPLEAVYADIRQAAAE